MTLLTRFSRVSLCNWQRSLNLNRCVFVRWYKRHDTPDADPELLQKNPRPHPEQEVFPGEYNLEHPKGKIYDKKPFKANLESEKKYSWCSCGHSHNQPFCDGSHKHLDGTSVVKKNPKYRPIKFTVLQTKDYWLCNCKQTCKAPFCDGTHKRPDIQEAIRS